MKEHKIYIIIAVLLILFLSLFLLFNLLSNRHVQNSFPEQTVIPTSLVKITSFPTSVPTGITSNKIFQLKYPLTFEGITIDFVKDKKQMIVYYNSQKDQAVNSFLKFAKQYDIDNINSLNIYVNFIGLAKDNSEPPPGFFQ